ncbi:MAG: AAA-like domain-containing protein [Microcystaceae cyanobacterium]
MKPPGWDQFLQEITHDYDLHGKLKEVFQTRFAYENWRKSDQDISALAEAASHETYKKQMTQIYGYFGKDKPNGCPELDPSSKGPGKFQIMREWFKEVLYPQWQQQQSPVNSPLISPQTRLVNASFTPPPTAEHNFYIPRPPIEEESLQALLMPGGLVHIKAPEKTGKTTLLKLNLSQLEQAGLKTVYLNFQGAERSMFSNLDKFLRWFCANISRELQLKPQLDDYWDEDLFGSLVSCKTYFQSYLLEQIGQPLVLGLDNLDRIFDYPEIAQDFLPMLRYWHEEANNLPIWQNLRLMIANSTEVYLKLDVNQSPFNVGKQIKLVGFNVEQIDSLLQAYGFEEDRRIELQDFILSLVTLVAGHPYLIRLAVETLKTGKISPQILLTEAPTQAGIYSTHLRHYWNNLQSVPELAAGMKMVVNSESAIALEPMITYRLESMGLISVIGSGSQPSCPLYQIYFRDTL